MNVVCENCDNRQAEAHQCNGDGGWHHHGKVHSHLTESNNYLQALCWNCWQIDKRLWAKEHRSTVGSGGDSPTA